MLLCVCADRESVFEEMSRWWAGVSPPHHHSVLTFTSGLIQAICACGLPTSRVQQAGCVRCFLHVVRGNGLV